MLEDWLVEWCLESEEKRFWLRIRLGKVRICEQEVRGQERELNVVFDLWNVQKPTLYDLTPPLLS